MMNLLGAVALSYLAGSGTITNSAVIGRGLFRAACRAAQGRFEEAAVETLASLTAPALMSYAATAALVLDAVGTARELAEPALGIMQDALQSREAA